jgi:hypothetical protein
MKDCLGSAISQGDCDLIYRPRLSLSRKNSATSTIGLSMLRNLGSESDIVFIVAT